MAARPTVSDVQHEDSRSQHSNLWSLVGPPPPTDPQPLCNVQTGLKSLQQNHFHDFWIVKGARLKHPMGQRSLWSCDFETNPSGFMHPSSHKAFRTVLMSGLRLFVSSLFDLLSCWFVGRPALLLTEERRENWNALNCDWPSHLHSDNTTPTKPGTRTSDD